MTDTVPTVAEARRTIDNWPAHQTHHLQVLLDELDRLRAELDAEYAHQKQAGKDYNAALAPVVRERDALKAQFTAHLNECGGGKT